MFLFLLGLFVLGAVVGSFLNVCIWRLPRGESVLHPPSHCPNCNTRLRPLDLIPIVSQVALRSRCRYCGNKISWRYCGMEVLTGVLFVMAGALPENFQNGVFVGDPLRLLQLMLFVSCLVVIFWVDFETMLIPMSAALLLGLEGIGVEAWRVLVEKQALPPVAFLGIDLLPAPLPHSLVAMIVLAGVMWSIGALSSLLLRREALGFGDVFLTAAIAANIGWNASLLTFLFLSSTIGVLVGLSLRVPRAIRSSRRAQSSTRLARRQLARPLFVRSLRKPVPFGPMLAVGALLAVLYGARLNQAYIQRFVGDDQNAPSLFLSNTVTR